MATIAAHLKSSARPVEWDTLLPSEQGVPWQVWVRSKGSGYWVFRWATKLARITSRLERALGRRVPDVISNPNGLEEPVAVESEVEAREAAKLFYEVYGGRVAVTYGPVVVGAVHPLESVPAVGDKPFDPFRTYDFSSTAAVRERSRLALVDVRELYRLRELDEWVPRLAKRLREAVGE